LLNVYGSSGDEDEPLEEVTDEALADEVAAAQAAPEEEEEEEPVIFAEQTTSSTPVTARTWSSGSLACRGSRSS
jgi:hypothetical protein